MRVKLFSLAATTPIQALENDINEFLESERPHVTYVSVSSSDIERVASVWYEEPHHRTVEQTMAELEELVEEPGGEGSFGSGGVSPARLGTARTRIAGRSRSVRRRWSPPPRPDALWDRCRVEPIYPDKYPMRRTWNICNMRSSWRARIAPRSSPTHHTTRMRRAPSSAIGSRSRRANTSILSRRGSGQSGC
jgi:hypothetical protein